LSTAKGLCTAKHAKTTKVEAFQADLEEFLRVLCGEKGFCGAVIGAIRS